MLTHSLQIRTAQKRLPATLRRQAGSVRPPFGVAKRITGRRPERAEASLQIVIDSALGIEEAIRCFVDGQPAQLYRGGA